MQNLDFSLPMFQAAVIVSLLFVAVGVTKPGWILFKMKNPKRVYTFLLGLVLFIGSYVAFSMKVGNPWQIATIHALLLADLMFLIVGMINPSWVFGSERLDRLWVSIIAVLLFMGLMTLQGVYYGPKSKHQDKQSTDTANQSISATNPTSGASSE